MAQVTPISLAIGTAIQPIEDPIDLARHNKIVLVQSLDLLGAQRDGRVTPAEADIRMMTFGFSQITDLANKAERFLKIAEEEGSFDTVAIRSLRLETLRFCLREWRNASATRGAFLLGERLAHVLGLPEHRLSHPIFARVVLAENLADLLSESLVTGRQFIAGLSRLRQIRSRVLLPRCHKTKAVTGPAIIQGTISIGMPIARPSSRSARP